MSIFKKKLIALFLTLAMLFSILPLDIGGLAPKPAYAAGTRVDWNGGNKGNITVSVDTDFYLASGTTTTVGTITVSNDAKITFNGEGTANITSITSGIDQSINTTVASGNVNITSITSGGGSDGVNGYDFPSGTGGNGTPAKNGGNLSFTVNGGVVTVTNLSTGTGGRGGNGGTGFDSAGVGASGGNGGTLTLVVNNGTLTQTGTIFSGNGGVGGEGGRNYYGAMFDGGDGGSGGQLNITVSNKSLFKSNELKSGNGANGGAGGLGSGNSSSPGAGGAIKLVVNSGTSFIKQITAGRQAGVIIGSGAISVSQNGGLLAYGDHFNTTIQSTGTIVQFRLPSPYLSGNIEVRDQAENLVHSIDAGFTIKTLSLDIP